MLNSVFGNRKSRKMLKSEGKRIRIVKVTEFVLLEESPEKTNALTSFFVAKFRMDM